MKASPATKAAAISDYMAGKGGYFQIASEYGISPFTLKKWVESPEKALNQASQKGIIELQSSIHSLHIEAVAPGRILSTCSSLFPQKEHFLLPLLSP